MSKNQEIMMHLVIFVTLFCLIILSVNPLVNITLAYLPENMSNGVNKETKDE